MELPVFDRIRLVRRRFTNRFRFWIKRGVKDDICNYDYFSVISGCLVPYAEKKKKNPRALFT